MEPCFQTIVLTMEAHVQSKQSFFHGYFQCLIKTLTRIELGPSLAQRIANHR